MKKFAFLAVLAGASAVAHANPSSWIDFSNLYVQGDVGYSKLEFKDDEKISDSNPSFRIALGKDVGVMRYAVDYTNYGNIKEVDEDGFHKLKTHSIGFSGMYDFPAVWGFTPYVGGRVGVNRLEHDWKDVEGVGSIDKTKVGIGVLAGAQYSLNDKMTVDAGIDYNYMGKVDDVKVNEYGAKVGLRYKF